ncbi:MAG TPA: peptidylprolyl isomerase, partial [Anaerolineae bacterium]|nr:peptidylprolyl isomerase [Anaerolineae bacterium]
MVWNRIRVLQLIFVAVLGLAACGGNSTPTPQATTSTTTALYSGAGAAAALPPLQRNNMYKSAPPMTIDVNKSYRATIQTAKGNIVVDLFPKDAPQHVNNFVFLARQGFFDGLTFHRVEPGFVIQG